MSSLSAIPSAPLGLTTAGRRLAATAALGVIALVLLYKETFAGMVHIWSDSGTYAHCWLVPPVAAWLLWRNRARNAGLVIRPTWAVLPLIALTTLAWWLANGTGFQLIEQLCAVGLVILVLWAICGTAWARMQAFPLGFLVLCVPLGEFLIPPLMDLTAAIAVPALRLVGVPVYREGFYIAIPGGDFLVAEACSGIRYLIASASLGLVFAYLAFHSLRKRLLFVGLAIVFPLIANGLRAFGIIWIAHLSEMKHAVSVDHIIYGWLFFGVVMMLMFWIGALMRDPPETAAEGVQPRMEVSLRILPAAVASLAVATLGPAIALARPALVNDQVLLQVPTSVGSWSVAGSVAPVTGLKLQGASRLMSVRYRGGRADVDVLVAAFAGNAQGKELVSSANTLYAQPLWTLTDRRAEGVRLFDGRSTEVQQLDVRSPMRRELLWQWYVLPPRATRSPLVAKFWAMRQHVSGRGGVGYLVMASTKVSDQPGEASAVLREFVSQSHAALTDCLTPGFDGGASPCAAPQ